VRSHAPLTDQGVPALSESTLVSQTHVQTAVESMARKCHIEIHEVVLAEF